jgi:hypothetical protein
MKKIHVITLVIAALALAGAAAGLVLYFVAPAPHVPGFEAAGDTNFTNVVASGDLSAGDDLTVGDDATITDALTAADLVASDDLTVGDDTTLTDAVTIGGITTVPTDTEHIGLYTVDAAAVITTTDGALWTVGASEIWFVHAVYCHVTTNFDCDGDDCTLNIGTGDDADGFIDLDDGELQTADTEGTGAPAGWQGFMSGDTAGAFLVNGVGFVIANDTIDIAVDDAGATDPSAGAATCYIVYLRIQ